MPELRTYNLPDITALSCIGLNRLGLIKTLQRQAADIVLSDMTDMGGLR